MSRIAYVNGRYQPHGSATVHIEDRGYQLADGVYEVVAIVGGKMVDEDPHLDRLDRSLSELRIKRPMARAALKLVMREVIRRNGVRDGLIYMQMTRGVAPRDHKFPKQAETAVVIYARRRPIAAQIAQARRGVKAITVPDIRWDRCDIKSIALLPNCLMKQRAAEAGAYEAWQVAADGTVTEGSSTNAWIVTKAGELVTRPLSDAILSGITRLTLLKIAREQGLKLVERPFTVAEALAAREAFVTSATSFVMPCIEIDGKPIGNGGVGLLCTALLDHYLAYIEREGEPVDAVPALRADAGTAQAAE